MLKPIPCRNVRTCRREGGAVWLALLTLILLFGQVVGGAPASAQDSASFPDLNADQRVYDDTGGSLTSAELTALEARVSNLQAIGADVVLYVRALDATPDETLDQVEALQQAWVAETGADQDSAVAILINRNPDDANDARAGIFVGKTFNDGNVPSDEQRAIVDNELIPPLRDGDVYGSFSGALDRLERSIVEGPPVSAFETWSADAGGSWLPWATGGLAVAGAAAAGSLFRKRQTVALPALMPVTTRPGSLTPALAGALAMSGPQVSALPATMLDLAARRAITFEPESEGGTFSKPKLKVRLLNHELVTDEVEEAVWAALEKRAELGVISSKNLARVATDTGDLNKVIKRQMRDAGWMDEAASGSKGLLMAIFVLALGLAVFSGVVAGMGSVWLPIVGVVAMAALAVTAIVMFGSFSSLSRSGQEAAAPWKAYREGLKQAAKDQMIDLDLDVVLADSVAMNLGSAMDDRLKAATASGLSLSAFTPHGGTSTTTMFPYWIAFNSSIATTSGTATSSTVSGGGAGGGGGAAGST